MRKICSNDQEKLLKFETEGREFEKKMRSLEQFNQALKGQNNFKTVSYILIPSVLTLIHGL